MFFHICFNNRNLASLKIVALVLVSAMLAFCWLYFRLTFYFSVVTDKLNRQEEILVQSFKEAAEKMSRAEMVPETSGAVTTETLSESKIKSIVLDEVERRISTSANIDVEKLLRDKKAFLDDVNGSQKFSAELRPYFTYYQPLVEHLNKLDQEESVLIEYVRNHLWIPAPPKNVPYALYKPNQVDFTEGQWPAIRDVFQNHENTAGYFIECGGLDGETSSNTLDLKLRYNWTGVLIEPSPINFGKLISKKRKAALVPACLSLEKRPTFVTFAQNVGIGRILNGSEQPLYPHVPVAKVQCMPFYSIYRVIDRKEIDFFILDIEGHEVEVLHTIPFDKINILTFMIEYLNGKTYDKNYMREFMLKRNYRLYNGTKRNEWNEMNYFFIKKGSKYDVEHP